MMLLYLERERIGKSFIPIGKPLLITSLFWNHYWLAIRSEYIQSWVVIWVLLRCTMLQCWILFFSSLFCPLVFILVLVGYQVPPEASKANGNHLLADDRNKYRSMWIRAHSTVWMIGGFALIIYMGHLYIWAMVVVIQIFMARELFCLLRKTHEDSHLPGFRLLNW